MSSRLRLPVVLSILCFASVARATLGPALQMQLGNPTSATADAANHTHYLIPRAQYALDYNDTTREPNWVAWDLTAGDVGGSGRSPDFFVDTTLPAGFYRVLTTDFSGSGYDRGHMCPSADRTATTADNQVTFYMSNMVPQSPDNNQGVWATFETYCRTLAAAGNELLITSGPSGSGGPALASGVAVPGFTWKIVVVVPTGPGAAIDRITATTRVITIKIPNVAGVRSNPWQQYITSPAQIETDTGATFFTALPASLAATLRAKTDDNTAAGAPRITTSPAAQAVAVGGTATFSVAATGNAPLAYQWSHDGDEITAATAATLTIPNVQAANLGDYAVVVTNAAGSVNSGTAALTFAAGADAGVITWDFSSATPTSGLPPDVTGGTVTQGGNNGTTQLLTNVSVSSGYAGVSAGNNAGAAARVGALNQTPVTGSAYFEFTLGTTAGHQLVVSSLGFGARSTGTGPQAFAIFTSADNFTAPLASGPLANNSVWTLITPTFTALAAVPGSALTFRIYGYNGAGNAGVSTANWRIDDLKIGITAVANSATPPIITRQPGSVVAVAGRTVTLTTVVTGTPAPTYQWRKDGVAIPGATNDTLTLTNVAAAQAGAYSVVVTNSASSVVSSVVGVAVLRHSYAGVYFGNITPGSTFEGDGKFALAINDDNTGVFLAYQYIPAFLSDLPAGGYFAHTETHVSRDVVVNDAGGFNFNATTYVPGWAATGGVSVAPPIPISPAPPLRIGADTIRGAISDTGVLTGTIGSSTLTATKSADGITAALAGFYAAGTAGSSAQAQVIVTGDGRAFAVVTSNVTGGLSPASSTTARQPRLATGDGIDAGAGTVSASGSGTLTTFNQEAVRLSFAASGALTATLANSSGTVATFTGFAQASVALASQRLVNLSTRASAGNNDQVAIVGFVIAGLESKTVLVRAVGPTLRTFGVTTALAAPRLDLMLGSTAVATNTGWTTGGKGPDIAAAAVRVSAFPLDAAGLDSAMLTTLAPGNYTAVVSASDGRAGAALIEVYDVSGGSLVQKLSNVSTRAFAGTGDNTLIAGVVVTGSAPKRVLIRAAGPALTQFGVPGAVARPVLGLYAGSALLAQNSGWSTSDDAAAISDATQRVGGFAFPAGSLDAAIIINLAPGAYTAQVTGVNGTTGVALVEVYELP